MPEILTETAAATLINILIGISSEIIPAMESQQNADKSFWRRVPKTAVDTMGIIGDTNVRVLAYLAGHSETSSALELPHILDAAYPAKQYSANEDMMNNFRYRLVLLASLGLIDKETEDPRVPDAKQAEIFRLTPRGFQLLSEYRKNDRYSELLEPVKEILHAFLLRE